MKTKINQIDGLDNVISDLEYKEVTIVGSQIRVVQESASMIIKFRLTAPITGAITISTDAGVTSIALKDGEGNDVTELQAGLHEVAYVTPFFILRSAGGLQKFYGDGSDGIIPNLNTATSAPNGGTVANLWDMNAGTVFTTGTLSSASDQILFEIDFGKTTIINGASLGFSMILFNSSISVGTRNVQSQYWDGATWVNLGTSPDVATTTPAALSMAIGVSFVVTSKIRILLKAGGSNCTFSCQGVGVNRISEAQTALVWRIIEPSTLNGGAVVKQYTSYTLPVGYEHTVQNPCQGLVIYSQGDITVNGIIDISQKAGLAPNGNIIPMLVTDFKSFDPYGIQKFYELTTKLQVLKGGAGGNGGYGGGYSGATGRQTSVGIGGAGRQNLGGFGGGGSGGNSNNNIGGVGGSVINSEIGGAKLDSLGSASTNTTMSGRNGYNGSGANGGLQATNGGFSSGGSGFAYGGGSGASGGSSGASSSSTTSDSQYAGGFLMLISSGNISNSGTIRANGGTGSNGSNGTGSAAGGGGGGGGAGGGVIALAHKGTYTNTGTIQVNGGTGGTGGAGVGTGEAGGTGTAGGVGTVADIQL